MTTCPVIIPGRRDKAYLTLKLDNSGDKGQFLQGELFQKAHGNYEAAICQLPLIPRIHSPLSGSTAVRSIPCSTVN